MNRSQVKGEGALFTAGYSAVKVIAWPFRQ